MLQYVHNKGLLSQLGPGIKAHIARATGSLDKEVHHDILLYKDLFTDKQKFQLRMEWQLNKCHLHDQSDNHMYNEHAHIDY